MRVSDLMTHDPGYCGPHDSLDCAARIMLTRDCGCVPVVDPDSQRVVGVVTDRDLTLRSIATGRPASDLLVQDVMSHPVMVIPAEADVRDCVRLMEQNQVRRAPAIDHSGRLVGIVAVADVARQLNNGIPGELVREISKGPDIGHAI